MSIVAVLTNPVLSTSSAKVLDANTNRKALYIRNSSGVSVYVKFDSAHVGTEGILLAAGAFVEWKGESCPINSVWAKAASTTPTIEVIEG